jgi:hypothetical protein
VIERTFDRKTGLVTVTATKAVEPPPAPKKPAIWPRLPSPKVVFQRALTKLDFPQFRLRGIESGRLGLASWSLLSKDPSHPGKLKAAHQYVTPGPHDDEPPSSGELLSAYGELRKFKKDYLD